MDSTIFEPGADVAYLAVRLTWKRGALSIRGLDAEGRHRVASWRRRAQLPATGALTREQGERLADMIQLDTCAIFDANCAQRYGFGDPRSFPWIEWKRARTAFASEISWIMSGFATAPTSDHILPVRPESLVTS